MAGFFSLDSTKNQQGTSTYTPGPELQGLDQTYLQNMATLMGRSGGSAAFTGLRPDLFVPGADEMALINRMGSLAGSNPYQPSDDATSAIRNLFGSAQNVSGLTGPLAGIMSQLEGQQTATPGGTVSPYETAGLDTLKGLMDPSALTDAYQKMYDQIVAPQIRNNATLMGQSGGSAVPEFSSRWLAQVAPNIAQQAAQGRQIYGGAQMGMGPTLENRWLGRQNQAGNMTSLMAMLHQMSGGLSGMAGNMAMGQQQMGMQGGISQMAQLAQALQAAGLPRLGALNNYNFDANNVNSLLGRIPLTNYGTSSSSMNTNVPANAYNYLGAGLGGLQGLSGLAGGIGSLLTGAGGLVGPISSLFSGPSSAGTASGDPLGTGALTNTSSDILRPMGDVGNGITGGDAIDWGNYL